MERGTKVSAINVSMARGFGVIKVFAFAAEKLDGLDVGDVGHAGREEGMRLAHYTRALAEIALLIFLALEKLVT